MTRSVISITTIEMSEGWKKLYPKIKGLVARIMEPQICDLELRLKALRSVALQRRISSRMEAVQNSEACELCSGRNYAHFCIDPFCNSILNPRRTDSDDCLHFTALELSVYRDIQSSFLLLVQEVTDLLLTGVSPEDLIKQNELRKLNMPS